MNIAPSINSRWERWVIGSAMRESIIKKHFNKPVYGNVMLRQEIKNIVLSALVNISTYAIF